MHLYIQTIFAFILVMGISVEERTVLTDFEKLITENIKSETVVPKLVQSGILSHEDKNSINLNTRNPDRVKALLNMLPKKQGQSFDAFCEAIKYKYTNIYDKLIQARQQAQIKPGKKHTVIPKLL